MRPHLFLEFELPIDNVVAIHKIGRLVDVDVRFLLSLSRMSSAVIVTIGSSGPKSEEFNLCIIFQNYE